jgi:hypothetical protein
MDKFEETAVIPDILCTAVGSMPHTDPDSAVDLIINSLHKAPHAPQLSVADVREQMWLQYTEGLPRFRVDLENQRGYFDTSGDSLRDVEEFYSRYLEITDGSSAAPYAIGPDYGRSILRFLDRLRSDGKIRPFVKVQVAGPLSFALTLNDETGKPIFYHPVFRDVAIKSMGLKAMWLLEQFQPYAENIIVFFDEPSLSAYGSSALLGVSHSDVVESLRDVISMVLQRGGIPGIHCCGNTDWGLMMETDTRVINFDAIDYIESMVIYARELSDWLARGGVLAWGAVPNSDRVERETAHDVIERIADGMNRLEKAGVDRALLRRSTIVTPACGCSGITGAQTEMIYHILKEIEEGLWEEHWQ